MPERAVKQCQNNNNYYNELYVSSPPLQFSPRNGGMGVNPAAAVTAPGSGTWTTKLRETPGIQ